MFGNRISFILMIFSFRVAFPFKDRWQVRFFLLQKIFRKSENVMLSVFFTVVCSDQTVWNSFKPCSWYYVCPPSSLSKPKVGKCPGQVSLLCECICKLPLKFCRCSQTRPYHTCFQIIFLQKFMLSFLSPDHIFIGSQFENTRRPIWLMEIAMVNDFWG